MKAMSSYISVFFNSFIDIVYKIFIFFAIYFIIQYRESYVVQMGSDLVEAAGFGGGFNQADRPVVGVGTSTQGFEFCDCWVGAGDHGLADIDQAGLMFTKTIQGLIDHP